MALKLITPPDPVVTLEEAKAQCRVEHSDDDALIQALIDAATAHVDGKAGYLKRALRPQTWELTYDEFPCGPIRIPLPPLIEIESVKYSDEDGTEQTVSVDDYTVDSDSEPGWVVLNANSDWPTTLDAINAVRIRFIAGYADELLSGTTGEQTTVPAPIRQAILMMVADMYEHRESVSADQLGEIPIPTTVRNLLHPFKVYE